MNGLSHAADNTALMRIFGPSPQANLEEVSRAILDRLKRAGDFKEVDRFRNSQRRLDDKMKEIDNGISLYQDIMAGKLGEGPQANAARLLINNIPGNNLFYVRAALDYTILNSFYEWLNPGYLRRMRRRIEKENNQTFYRQPTMWQ